MSRTTIAFVVLLGTSCAFAQVGPGQPFASESAYREWLTIHAMQMETAASRGVRVHAAAAAITSTPAQPQPWYASAVLTVPVAAATWNASTRSYAIALTDQLTGDANTASRWAVGANAQCVLTSCDGQFASAHAYNWLVGNGAAYRNWRDRGNGEDPVTWLCRQGYDSPLATYTERWTFNRTADEANLTVAKVQYNAHDYPAQIVPQDCLAGCFVYADIPCTHERQTTIIELFAEDASVPWKCVGYRDGVGFETSACGGAK